jgi:hypothetical protein
MTITVRSREHLDASGASFVVAADGPNASNMPLTTVELHGNATVYEPDETMEPLKHSAFDPSSQDR